MAKWECQEWETKYKDEPCDSPCIIDSGNESYRPCICPYGSNGVNDDAISTIEVMFKKL